MPAFDTLRGKPVFVTGATGFIGRALVARLGAAGAQVTALTRAGTALPGVRNAVRGTLTSPDLPRLLTGHEVLFNLAYDVRASAATNLNGFRALMAAAGTAGVGRVIHASSIVVHDGWPSADIAESAPVTRDAVPGYRQAKQDMEAALLATGLPCAILRPTIVWGPGSSLWTDRYGAALTAGGVVIADTDGLCNGLYIDDLVDGFLLAASLSDLGQEVFNLSGPKPFGWAELITGYADCLGTASPDRQPAAALAARLGPQGRRATGPSPAARISATARRLIGHRNFEALVRRLRRPGSGPLYPDRTLLTLYTSAGTCSIGHARARLGYAPNFDLARGLQETCPYLTGKFK